jgi:rhodanese-related sulfurtransferase
VIGAALGRLGTGARLALVAAVLGLGAFVIGDPGAGSKVTLDTAELAAIVESEVDHVTPDELADWLLAGRQDYRVLDLRPEADYAAYHVPGAERLAIPDLAAADLPRNEKYVLYSEEGIHSAQAWMLLRAKRYPAVYILLGGLAQWREQVLFPVAPPEGAPAEERLAFAARAERARHFGGAPRAAAAGGPTPELLPAPTAPPVVAPPVAPAAPAGGSRKKKEGC